VHLNRSWSAAHRAVAIAHGVYVVHNDIGWKLLRDIKKLSIRAAIFIAKMTVTILDPAEPIAFIAIATCRHEFPQIHNIGGVCLPPGDIEYIEKLAEIQQASDKISDGAHPCESGDGRSISRISGSIAQFGGITQNDIPFTFNFPALTGF